MLAAPGGAAIRGMSTAVARRGATHGGKPREHGLCAGCRRRRPRKPAARAGLPIDDVGVKTRTVAALLLVVPLGAAAQEPVFDLHVHLREGAASVDAYEAQVASAKRHVTAFGAMWFGGPRQARQGDVAGIRSQNDALLALAARNPKLVPIATVHPYDGQAALDEVARVAGLGARVLKLHPHTQQFDIADPRVLALVERAGALGVVVLMDNAGIVAGDSEHLFNLAARAPKTIFVFAHLGGMHFRFWNMLALARTAKGFGLENVYFDLSGTVVLVADSPLEAEFVWTLRNVGVDRVLLGSDYPQISLAQALDALDRLDLDPSEKARIRYQNARRLLGR
jgi:predicted TIM-barrel fold metal-dependent hydrolase